MCQVSKLQHMYVIGLILFSVLKTTKQTRLYQVWKQINLGRLSRVSFLPSCSNETTSMKTIWIPIHTLHLLYVRLLWPISVLTKNLSRRKKFYIKVFLKRFMLILIIYNNSNWMWCLVTLTKLSTLHYNKVVVLQV